MQTEVLADKISQIQPKDVKLSECLSLIHRNKQTVDQHNRAKYHRSKHPKNKIV